jgi:hypothetical protein
MNHHTNIVNIKSVYNALRGVLDQEFIFVGGAVVSLYADRNAEEVRPTDDVDVLVEIYTRTGYSELEERLRKIGFRNDTNSRFVGRYTLDNLTVDFMPLEENILGFNNGWYKEGFKNAIEEVLDERTIIKIFPASYFLAAKLEAFKSRGKNKKGEHDGRLSTDFEDIVFLLVNRATIWHEMQQAENSLKTYLQTEFTNLLQNPYFEEWIDVHAGYRSSAAQTIILPKVKEFVSGN